MDNFDKKIDTTSSDYGIHILNHSSDKIFVVDHDYRLKYFNPVAQKYSFLFGINQLELGIKMLPSTDVIFWKKAFDQALANLERFHVSAGLELHQHTSRSAP